MHPMAASSASWPAKSARVPARSSRRLPWLAAAALILLGIATELWSPAEAKPDPSQLAAMADALKYLQELDKYYSQVARPRFGKRAELRPVPDDSNSMESGERLWGRLTKRR
ncbi:neuropeptide F isoform X2 [Ischnura elegans]|uniref:neuropeptide F isoform X2 n=1 Tax=Ischnura elegans TaxID=197161 RepID=UPI001ED8A90C|nr:neuropeptide F isoform X2 [Ischnura elegans]